MEFYLNQLKTGPNFRLYNIEVQQKIWCFEDLKSYIINVTASVRESNTKSDSITIDKNKDKDAEKDLLLDMQETIEKLRQEVTEKEKLIKNSVSGTRESLNTNPILQNILQIVQSNQQSIDKNFKSLEVVTSHMEHMINKKGKFSAFLKVYKSPVSIQVDKFSMVLTIIGSEMVVDMMGMAAGPFGEDLPTQIRWDSEHYLPPRVSP